MEILLQQAALIESLREQVESLQHENERLRSRLEGVEREGKRQAAPFRRADDERSADPAPPGRKPGHQAHFRRAPEQVDEEVTVSFPADPAGDPGPLCPQCGEGLAHVRPIEQTIEELPPVTPVVTRLVTYRGACAHCGTVETRHPLQTSRATGAASAQLGPRAQALATSLVHQHGMTLRRACGVLEGLFGLSLSPGGLTQLLHRMRARGDVEQAEADLLAAAREGDVQHVDETSWWVARAQKPQQWLWVFADAAQTLYRVRAHRRGEVVEDVLTGAFRGVLVTDCLPIYDRLDEALFADGAKQQKCYAHHLKALSTQRQAYREAHGGRASPYIQRLRGLLLGAMALRGSDLPPGRRKRARAALEKSADRLLNSDRADPHEEKIRKRLRKQREHLFVFLDQEQVPATNNLAERRLRPAVIRRKLSCGNRSARGARTWECLASIAATCVQQGRSVLDFFEQAASLTRTPLPIR